MSGRYGDLNAGTPQLKGRVVYYFWIMLMGLSDLWTTASIASLDIHHRYYLELPNPLIRAILWTCWMLLPMGALLVSFGRRARSGRGLLAIGFLSAIALSEFDARCERHPNPPIAGEWKFEVGYASAYALAIVAAYCLYRLNRHREAELEQSSFRHPERSPKGAVEGPAFLWERYGTERKAGPSTPLRSGRDDEREAGRCFRVHAGIINN